MTIALIGGSGFIGGVLAQKLIDQGHDIKILDLVPPQDSHASFYKKADITNPETLHESLKDVDAIIHLAAAHRDDIFPRSIYYDVNEKGTQNIIDAAQSHNIKTIIFTSTVAVYGLNSGDSKEVDTPSPFNDYGQSKLNAEQCLNRWHENTPDSTLVILRLVATFGAGNKGNVFTLINQVHTNRFLMIGNGQNAKSIAYIQNVADFIVSTLKFSPAVHLYNYADKPDLSMINMVNIIRGELGKTKSVIKVPYFIGLIGGYCFDILAKITGKTFPISSIRIKKFCANTIVNSDKLKDKTDFKPSFTLEEGLKQMIRRDFKH